MTPSEELAKRITDRLINEGLLSTADGLRLVTKIADGTAKRDDWRLAIEKSDMEERDA